MTRQLSYSSGIADKPLLGLTVGAALRSAAIKYPDRDAIVSLFQGLRYTYAEFDRAADDVAASLVALGVTAGDRVAIWSANRAEWLIAHHGAARIGAIVVTVNPALRQGEAEHILGDSEASVIFAARNFRTYSFVEALSDMRAKLPNLQHLIYFGDGPAKSALTWGEFLALGTPDTLEKAKVIAKLVTFDDACNIQYTSGTTGRPKGALLTHHGLLNQRLLRWRAATPHRAGPHLPSRALLSLLWHRPRCARCLTHGSALILPAEGFETKSALTSIVQEGCTSFYGVPMMYIALLNDPDFGQFDLRSLRTGCMGGAPCPTETMRQAVSRMHMHGITVVYGMTETSPISHQSLADDDNETRVSTVGTIHPHLQAKVIDPVTGATQPIGQSGELCIRGYSVMQGYWGNPTATSEAIDAKGWMHTGDLAVMNNRGYVQIVGRIKDTVIRGGREHLSSRDRRISRQLARHSRGVRLRCARREVWRGSLRMDTAKSRPLINTRTDQGPVSGSGLPPIRCRAISGLLMNSQPRPAEKFNDFVCASWKSSNWNRCSLCGRLPSLFVEQ